MDSSGYSFQSPVAAIGLVVLVVSYSKSDERKVKHLATGIVLLLMNFPVCYLIVNKYKDIRVVEKIVFNNSNNTFSKADKAT